MKENMSSTPQISETHRKDDLGGELGKLVTALNNISEAVRLNAISTENIIESVKLNAIANERNSRNMEKMIDMIAEKQLHINKQT